MMCNMQDYVNLNGMGEGRGGEGARVEVGMGMEFSSGRRREDRNE